MVNRTTSRALALSISLSACAHTLQVPTAPMSGPGAALPPLSPSQINVPLSADVRQTLAALEQQVPPVTDTGGEFRMIGPTPVGIRYRVQRGPFRFEAHDGGLRAETTLRYTAEACLGAPMGIPIPFLASSCQPVASCGINEAPRTVVVRTDTRLTLDGQWHLQSQTQPLPPELRDRCELTAFHIDVSAFIEHLVSEQVQTATARMDASIAEHGDLRPRAEQFWNALQQSMDLGEGFWMNLQPQSVHAGPLAIDPSSARTTVGIVALPQVTSGAPRVSAPRPLPPLEAAPASAATGGFQMTFDATVPFAEATALLVAQFRGRSMDVHGYQCLVREISVARSGAALLFTIDMTFQSGPFSGQEARVYMAGLPDWDANRRALVVRDLDYTLETRNSLLQTGEWLMRGGLRDSLTERAVFPMGDRLDRLRQHAETALSRPLSPGTDLHGRLSAVHPQGAFVTEDGIVVRVVADGSAEVTQDVNSLHLTGANTAAAP